MAPVLLIGWVLVLEWRGHTVATDFKYAFLPAAHAVVSGGSPYPSATVAILSRGTAFVYPPLTAYLVAPFTLVSAAAASWIVTALMVGSVPLALWILEIRDWRCYGAAFLWAPVIAGIQTANVTLPLLIGISILWRLRRRVLPYGITAGLLIAIKLFAWPILVWALATRRYRAGLSAGAFALIFVACPWAVLGFVGLGGYPHLLNVLSSIEAPASYSIPALLRGVMPWSLAEVIGDTVGIAILASAVWLARCGRDSQSFVVMVVAILVLSPIAWLHYFALLLAVIAIASPRFGPLWLVPIAFWLCPGDGNGQTWQTAVALSITGLVLVMSVRASNATSVVPRQLRRMPRGEKVPQPLYSG